MPLAEIKREVGLHASTTFEVAGKIRRRIEACGGAEWVVLNPLSFDAAQLERLAYEVRPGISG